MASCVTLAAIRQAAGRGVIAMSARDTCIDITPETRDRHHLDLVLRELQAEGYEVRIPES